ncbi:MAG: alkaline phosphatase PhoX, partial [Pseudomonadota bacterium]
MSQIDYEDLSFDDEDEMKFPRPTEQEFDRVVERALSRRGFMGGVLAFGSGAAVMGIAGLKGTTAMAAQTSRFAFDQLAPQTDGTVHVPSGYAWDVLVRWGDPLFSDAPAFDATTGIPTEGSDRVFGENTDGMELFHLGGTELLVVNSEYVNTKVNLAAEQEGKVASADDVVRLQNFQGVTVMEVAEGESGWEVVVDSPYNRRIHHRTPMVISGPAAGHDLLKTDADPTGTASLGTFNNCGSGRTPWGTYLT